MADSLKLPYLHKDQDRGGFKIWIVDGSYVRGHIEEEFTNFGQHYRYPYIPENELWIDEEAENDERKFFIDHLLLHELHERNRMAGGMPYSQAHAESSRLEFRCRHHPR